MLINDCKSYVLQLCILYMFFFVKFPVNLRFGSVTAYLGY